MRITKKETTLKAQKNWSKRKTRCYDSYVFKSNRIKEMLEEIKQAKNRNDLTEVKRLNKTLKTLKLLKKRSIENFKSID